MTTATTSSTGAESVTWDLSDLYTGPDDPRLDADLDAAVGDAAAFRERYRGRIASLDAAALRDAIAELERISSVLSRVGTFAQLRFATDTADPGRGALMQRVQEIRTQVSNETVFARLEWLAVDDDAAAALVEDPELAAYAHFLSSMRRYRPHVLSEPEERIVGEMKLTGASAFNRLFSEVDSAARVRLDGEELSLERALSMLQRPDARLRERVAEALTAALAETLRIRAFVFNTILLDKATDDRLRGYEHWLASRNLSNEVSDASVDALVEAVTSRYDIPNRYYALKARLLGVDRLKDYDRFAPLGAEPVEVSWEEARATVESAYDDFSPQAGRVIRDFFERSWIDAAPGDNRMGGAFCSTTVPGVHPYVFMTFTGERRSVLTLAHELGHGLHGALAGRNTLFNAGVPLTLAETASVFGEALTFHRLLRAERDPRRRLDLITGQLEDAIATVFRQISMNRFEDAVHTARRSSGELSIDDFSEMWVATQSAVLGDAVEVTDGYRTWWSYIPHFLVAPGYVYAYAYGYLFSYAIFRRYQELGQEVVDPYLDLLGAGGSAPPAELARTVGVDLDDPSFWTRGLDAIDASLAEAEELAASIEPD